MSRMLLGCLALALAAAPDGPVPDPDPPAPEFVVTRADVERILREARAAPASLLDPMGLEHRLYCFEPDAPAPDGAELLVYTAARTGGVPSAIQDGSDPNGPPPPEPPKPFDPKKYDYPFPEDASEALAKMLRDADEKTLMAQRKPPQLEQFEAANALYEAAGKTGNKYAYPWFRIAQNNQAILEFRAAEDAIKQALRIDPDSPHVLTEEGDIHKWNRDRRRALASYNKAIQVDPKFVPAYLSRAQLYMQQHDWELAKADVQKAIELEPTAEGFKQMMEQLKVEIDNMGFNGDDVVLKETSHYQIYCYDKGLANLVAAHAEAIYAYYTERFPKANLGGVKFSVYLFADRKQYVKAGGGERTGGFYSPAVRKLVLPVNWQDKWKPGKAPDDKNLRNTLLVLYHEGFHQFLHYSLENAPQWFNEGHGDYYGGARWDPQKKRPGGGIGYFGIGLMGWRTPTVKQMVAGAGRYEELQRLMQETRAEFYMPRTVGLNYAQAWSIVHFLHSREDWGRQLLVPYYKELRKGSGLRSAFDRTFGRVDMDKFEEQWVDFARAKQK